MRSDFGGGTWRARILDVALRNSVKRVIQVWSLAPEGPWPYGLVDHLGRLQKKVAGTTHESVIFGKCSGEITRTPDTDSGNLIVYFHGGAFLVGGKHLHRAMISRIAQGSRTPVLAVNYRQLPRHSVATSTADCLDAYRHALGLGFLPEQIIFMGDSAGGFLTFTVADAARQEGLPTPAGIVAISPLVDFDFVRSPLEVARRGCGLFTPRAFNGFGNLARLRGGSTVLHSPADCRLGSLPPVLIQVSSTESLYAQVARFAQQISDAGVPVNLQVWDHQLHVFQAASILPEAREAVAEIASFVTRLGGVHERRRYA